MSAPHSVALKFDKNEIESFLQTSKENRTEQKLPYQGEVDGYNFVLDHIDDTESILDEYIDKHKRQSTAYDRLHRYGLIPFLGWYLQKRAWYYEGYTMALGTVLNVHIYSYTDSNGTKVVLKDDDTETELRTLKHPK